MQSSSSADNEKPQTTLYEHLEEKAKSLVNLILDNKVDEACDILLNSQLPFLKMVVVIRKIFTMIGNADILLPVTQRLNSIFVEPQNKLRYQFVHRNLLEWGIINGTHDLTRVFQECLKLVSLEEIAKFIYDFLKIELPFKILKSLEKLEKQFAHKFFFSLLQVAFDHRNLNTILLILDQHPKIYTEFCQKINEQTHQEKTIVDVITGLMQIENQSDQQFAIEMMTQFISGFGGINYEGGLVLLATIASRKSYFNPTLLQSDEVAEYLNTIRNSIHPCREIFIISSSHWVCGMITKNKEGDVNIVIIDSLGQEKDRINCAYIETFNDKFPTAHIYYTFEQRQMTKKGCSIFSFDDARHLFTINNYLPYDLFDYLKMKEIGRTSINSQEIIISALPLSLMRTMQSSSLLTMMENSVENKNKLNKRGDTGYSIFQEKKGFISKKTPEGEKYINKRLDDKLEKMSKECFQYLLGNNKTEITKAMHAHTLIGFKERIHSLEVCEQKSKRESL